MVFANETARGDAPGLARAELQHTDEFGDLTIRLPFGDLHWRRFRASCCARLSSLVIVAHVFLIDLAVAPCNTILVDSFVDPRVMVRATLLFEAVL
jgi:hypothetical protein